MCVTETNRKKQLLFGSFTTKESSDRDSFCRYSCNCIVLRGHCAAVSLNIAVTADMEEFIKDYITEANREIELFNRQLELQGQPDLFDP